jgi:hypothetical protein
MSLGKMYTEQLKKYNARNFPVHAWQGHKGGKYEQKTLIIGFSN